VGARRYGRAWPGWPWSTGGRGRGPGAWGLRACRSPIGSRAGKRDHGWHPRRGCCSTVYPRAWDRSTSSLIFRGPARAVLAKNMYYFASLTPPKAFTASYRGVKISRKPPGRDLAPAEQPHHPLKRGPVAPWTAPPPPAKDGLRGVEDPALPQLHLLGVFRRVTACGSHLAAPAG